MAGQYSKKRRFGLSSSEVVELTGVTPRQLQWWDECRVVIPQKHGRNRRYDLKALARIAILCECKRRGLSLKRSMSTLKWLEGQSPSLVVLAIMLAGIER